MNKIKIAIAGDVVLSKRVCEATGGGILDNKISKLFADADIAIANLECPLTDGEAIQPIQKSGPVLHGYTEGVRYLIKQGINLFTLANNHILDYGYEGLERTIKKLGNTGFVGAGLTYQDLRRYKYIDTSGGKIVIINVCEHEFSVVPQNEFGANPLDIVNIYYDIQQAKNESDFVIVLVHGGHEHFQLPSPRMKKLYRCIIDMGADVVVNGHQHCFSGYEEYKTGLIFYGIGNFIFEKLDLKDKTTGLWNEGLILSLSLSLQEGRKKINYEIHPFLQCDGTANVCLYDKSTKEYNRVLQRIQELNNIIQDDFQLQKEFEAMSYARRYHFLMLLVQFRSRLMKALCWRKIIPDNLTKNRLLLAKNSITCESHLDVFREFINVEINKK